jgi:adenine deaminase
MVVVSDLQNFDIDAVFIDGRKFDADNSNIPRYEYPSQVLNTIKLGPVAPETFAIKAPANTEEVTVRVMTIIDGTVATREEHEPLAVQDGLVQTDVTRDLLKVAVFDRYQENGYHALGIVRGFGFQKGAFGGSIGQDSQNLVVVGADDEDMALVVNTIREMQGGVVFAAGGKELARVELPIAGIMSDLNPRELQKRFKELHKCLADLGGKQVNPTFTLSLLLTCAVIPELKITNRGLVDALSGEFVPLII